MHDVGAFPDIKYQTNTHALTHILIETNFHRHKHDTMKVLFFLFILFSLW